MALTALLQKQPLEIQARQGRPDHARIFGAALFYGDGIITPAISVLFAVEGLKVATPGLSDLVLPIAIGVLTALFLVQSRGTSRVGGVFGPIMALWFAILAAAGIREIGDNPAILKALSPTYGRGVHRSNTAPSRSSPSARWCWPSPAPRRSTPTWATSGRRRSAEPGSWLVFPALTLNYLGQGALVLRTPAAVENPFYMIFPRVGSHPDGLRGHRRRR